MNSKSRKHMLEIGLALFNQWNWPIGTEVIVREDNRSETRTKTRSLPWMLGDGTPVILLEGRSGGYLLERIRPAEREKA